MEGFALNWGIGGKKQRLRARELLGQKLKVSIPGNVPLLSEGEARLPAKEMCLTVEYKGYVVV
jgi:hypothetical protein